MVCRWLRVLMWGCFTSFAFFLQGIYQSRCLDMHVSLLFEARLTVCERWRSTIRPWTPHRDLHLTYYNNFFCTESCVHMHLAFLNWEVLQRNVQSICFPGNTLNAHRLCSFCFISVHSMSSFPPFQCKQHSYLFIFLSLIWFSHNFNLSRYIIKSWLRFHSAFINVKKF